MLEKIRNQRRSLTAKDPSVYVDWRRWNRMALKSHIVHLCSESNRNRWNWSMNSTNGKCHWKSMDSIGMDLSSIRDLREERGKMFCFCEKTYQNYWNRFFSSVRNSIPRKMIYKRIVLSSIHQSESILAKSQASSNPISFFTRQMPPLWQIREHFWKVVAGWNGTRKAYAIAFEME